MEGDTGFPIWSLYIKTPIRAHFTKGLKNNFALIVAPTTIYILNPFVLMENELMGRNAAVMYFK